MTDRLKIKIDMKERYMQRMEDMGKYLVHEAQVDIAMKNQPDKKKLSKEDIKRIIQKGMTKVEGDLNKKFTEISDKSAELNNTINENNEKLKSQFSQWQNEQETYMQSMHNDVLQLQE